MKDPELRTAESVSPHHPDKLCDRMSDAILDAYLAKDARARVAVEVVGGHGKVFVTGEITSMADVEIEPLVRRIAREVEIEVRVARQSPEIAAGVDTGGAGDQGIMVGYATRETPELLPLEVVLARKLNQFLYKIWPYDGKTQVTVRGQDIVTIVASFQHAQTTALEAAVKDWASNHVVDYTGAKYFTETCDANPTLHINPAGNWQIGGFDADAGLTGRKLVVDNYGPRIPIGGGCYSGKDPSKVDRSAAYMARKIAVDYLKRFVASEVYVYLAYAIGYDQPIEAVAVVDGRVMVIEEYDLSPLGIVKFLDLCRPIYENTARYGHFGHEEFSWR